MKKVKSFIESEITIDIDNYNNASDDVKKQEAYNNLITHYKLGMSTIKGSLEEQKLELQAKNDESRRKQEKERLSLEKTRLESELEFRNKQLEMEEERLSLEKKRLESEQFDRNRRAANEEKHDKIMLITTICSIAVPAVVTIISKCIYAGLAINAQKHDYRDYVMESKYSKEARDNLNK